MLATHFALKLFVLRCTVVVSLAELACWRGSVAGEGGMIETSSRDVALVPNCPERGGSSFKDNL